MVRAFDEEFRRFRVEAAQDPPDLTIEPGKTCRRPFTDPAFDVLPDGIDIDRRAPILRYDEQARSGLLIELAELSMRWPDKALVHAASAERDGAGLLIAAPNATGKTSALVELLAARHGFLADDWSLIDRHGRLHAFPKSIHVYDYNLAEVPALRGRIPDLHPWSERLWGVYGRMRTRLLASLKERPRFFLKHVAKKKTWHLEAGHFGTRVAGRTEARVAVWLQRDDVPEIHVEPIAPADFARRAVSYLLYDRAAQLRMIHRLVAFGEAPWLAHVEGLPKRTEAILTMALRQSGAPHLVRVPRTASAREIADRLSELVAEDTQGRRAVAIPKRCDGHRQVRVRVPRWHDQPV